MRVTIVNGFFLPVPPLRGGATEKSWHGLSKVLASEGHSVTYVSRQWPGLPDHEVVDGVTHIRCKGFDHSRFLPLNMLFDLVWGRRVARVLPDSDALVCNTITMPSWISRFRPSVGKVAVMIGRVPKGQTFFYGGVSRIYVPSTAIKEQLSTPEARNKTVVTGYPIEWDLHARASNQESSPATIGYVGRVHPEKGVDLLIRAACLLALRKDLPEWKLRIVGPSKASEGGGGQAWFDSLKARSSALGNRIEWVAAEYDQAALARIYGKIDIFCYPSLAEKGETFGVSIAEAMAARCAVVVSGLKCFGDLVADRKTGLVFDHHSPDADQVLADDLALLISDERLRMAIAERGQRHTRSFDYSEMARKITDDLSVLAGKRGENG